MPGWHATANGRPLAVHSDGPLFQAVDVPAGRSTVSFGFTPPHAALALLAGALGLVCLVLAWAAPRRVLRCRAGLCRLVRLAALRRPGRRDRTAASARPLARPVTRPVERRDRQSPDVEGFRARSGLQPWVAPRLRSPGSAKLAVLSCPCVEGPRGMNRARHEVLSQLAAPSSQVDGIFVVGMFASGTDLLGAALSALGLRRIDNGAEGAHPSALAAFNEQLLAAADGSTARRAARGGPARAGAHPGRVGGRGAGEGRGRAGRRAVGRSGSGPGCGTIRASASSRRSGPMPWGCVPP